MKTVNSSKTNEQIFVIKQILFAFQVLIICAAIPVLSYLQLTHKNDKTVNDPRTAMEVKELKNSNTVHAANTTAQIYTFVW